MSKLTNRIERLERRQSSRKLPSNDEDVIKWALDSLFNSPQAEVSPVDGELSPYLVFLKLVKSGEIEREAERRGFPLEKDEPPAWQKEWLEGGAQPGKWSDEINLGSHLCGGHVEPY